jgi:hypothetical protein
VSIDDIPKSARPWDGHERRARRDDDYTGPERRGHTKPTRQVREGDLDVAAILGRFAAIENRLDRGSERMASIEADLRANTEVTREVRDLMEMGRVLFRLADLMGRGAKWLGGIATAILAVWGAFYTATHGGKPPGH